METLQKPDNIVTGGLRWTARANSLLVTGLFLLYLVQSGALVIPALSWSSLRGMPMLSALALAVAGTIIAWKCEMIGGCLTLVGAVAVLALAYLASGPGLLLTASFLSLPLVVSGILYLACYSSLHVCQTMRNQEAPADRSSGTLATV